MSRIAQLNVEADLLAKKEWSQRASKGEKWILPTVETGEITVRVQERILTPLRRNKMYEMVTKELGYNYWNTRLDWEEGTEEQEGWDEMEICRNGSRKSNMDN